MRRTVIMRKVKAVAMDTKMSSSKNERRASGVLRDHKFFWGFCENKSRSKLLPLRFFIFNLDQKKFKSKLTADVLGLGETYFADLLLQTVAQRLKILVCRHH